MMKVLIRSASARWFKWPFHEEIRKITSNSVFSENTCLSMPTPPHPPPKVLWLTLKIRSRLLKYNGGGQSAHENLLRQYLHPTANANTNANRIRNKNNMLGGHNHLDIPLIWSYVLIKLSCLIWVCTVCSGTCMSVWIPRANMAYRNRFVLFLHEKPHQNSPRFHRTVTIYETHVFMEK